MTKLDRWRKSSYSEHTNPQCVEVGLGAGLVGVRDSRDREHGHLEVPRAAWSAFVRSVTR